MFGRELALWCAWLATCACVAAYTVDCNRNLTDCDQHIKNLSLTRVARRSTTASMIELSTVTDNPEMKPKTNKVTKSIDPVTATEAGVKGRLLSEMSVEELQAFANVLHNHTEPEQRSVKPRDDLSDVTIESEEDEPGGQADSKLLEQILPRKFLANLQEPFLQVGKDKMDKDAPPHHCVENGTVMLLGEKLERGCDETCECGTAGEIQCWPRCRHPFARRGDRVKDPMCFESYVDDCCAIITCPNGNGNNEAKPPTLEIASSNECFDGNTTHTDGAIWFVGCTQICSCDKGHTLCKPRCDPIKPSEKCISVQDPTDMCCEIQVCDVSQDAHEEPPAAGEKPTRKMTSPTEPQQTPPIVIVKEEEQFNRQPSRPLVLSEPIGSVKVLQNNSVQVTLMHMNNTKDPIHLLLSSDGGKSFQEIELSYSNLILNLEGGRDYILKTKETNTKFNFTITNMQSASDMVVVPVKVTEDGCYEDGVFYKVGAEFHIGCTSLCECLAGGARECAALECPTAVGLELVARGCVRWAPPPPAQPPHCCPRSARCLSDGTCRYNNVSIPNWSEVPISLTGCEKRCFCENGELECQEVCSPLPAVPPPSLRCPPAHHPAPLNVSDDDCCKEWGCLPNDEPEPHEMPHLLDVLNKDSIYHLNRIVKPNHYLYDQYNNYNNKLPNKMPSWNYTMFSYSTTPRYDDNYHTYFPDKYDYKTSYSVLPQSGYTDTTKRVNTLPNVINPIQNVELEINYKFDSRLKPDNLFVTMGPNTNKSRLFNYYTSTSVDRVQHNKVIPKLFEPNQDRLKPKPAYNIHYILKKPHDTKTGILINTILKKKPLGKQNLSQDLLTTYVFSTTHRMYTKVEKSGMRRPMMTPVHRMMGHRDRKDNVLNQLNDINNLNPHSKILKENNKGRSVNAKTGSVAEAGATIMPPKKPTPGFLPTLPPDMHFPHDEIPDYDQNNVHKPIVPHQVPTGPGLPPIPPGYGEVNKKLTVISLQADSPSSVKMLFGLPPVLVGLRGSVDLRYTDKEDEDISKWYSQVFAPAEEVLTTSRLEFRLSGLKPSTQYKVRAKLYLHNLPVEPESEVYTVRTQDMPIVEEKRREIDSQLTVVDVNDTTAHLSWRHFTDDELMLIDGIQIRYRPVGAPIYQMTELLHHARTSAALHELRPDTRYEAALVLPPPPRARTELHDPAARRFSTAPQVDPYGWSVTAETVSASGGSVQVSWRGVPAPAERWVRAARLAAACPRAPEQDAFRLAARDAPTTLALHHLPPDTKCRVWVELFLTNGKVKTSNVLEVNTKSVEESELLDNSIDASSVGGVSAAGAGGGRGDYYGALVGVGAVAALGAVTSLLLLLIVVRRHRPRTHHITPLPTAQRESSLPPYDNPAFKLELQQETMDL